ncbi:hypothetical protein, partial [Atlantibacter hermannii]
LHHLPSDEAKVKQALSSLTQRIREIEPRQDSKEPLVLQQIGLIAGLLPEISSLQHQVSLSTD